MDRTGAERRHRTLRAPPHAGIAALRVEFTRELHAGLAAVRQEIAAVRVELIRWSFVFWIGQIAAMIGILAFMLRNVG